MNEVNASVEYINILLYIHIFMEWYSGRLSKHSSGNLVEQLKGLHACFFKLLFSLVNTVVYIWWKEKVTITIYSQFPGELLTSY